MKIVNLGSLNVDHVYRVDRSCCPGEHQGLQGLNDNAGGKGLNQSIAAARTGAEVYHAGYFGSGSERCCGRFCRRPGPHGPGWRII